MLVLSAVALVQLMVVVLMDVVPVVPQWVVQTRVLVQKQA
jgi:hypothetical protein